MSIIEHLQNKITMKLNEQDMFPRITSSMEINLFLREKQFQCITRRNVRSSFPESFSTGNTDEKMVYAHEVLPNIKKLLDIFLKIKLCKN